jgi:hypothetical protein
MIPSPTTAVTMPVTIRLRLPAEPMLHWNAMSAHDNQAIMAAPIGGSECEDSLIHSAISRSQDAANWYAMRLMTKLPLFPDLPIF